MIFFLPSNWASYTKTKDATDQRYHDGTLLGSGYGRDSKPDEFSFSFLNYSGTFYIDENRNWRVRSDVKLEIEMSNSFQKFTITDPSGVQYVFGDNENDIEYCGAFLDVSIPEFRRKTWNLSRIISTSGEVIQFEYERGSTILNPQPWWHFSFYSSGNVEINRMTGSQIKPSYLKKIITPVSEVIFERSTSKELKYRIDEFESHRNWALQNWLYNYVPFINYFTGGSPQYSQVITAPDVTSLFASLDFQQLNSIKVKSYFDARPIEQIDFTYSSSYEERLKLKSIVNLIKKRHQFYYTDDFNNQLKFPAYCSGQIDLWGFYNGRTQDYTSNATFLASREPDVNKLQYELLKRIVYPTKGYSDYTFEAHSYSKEVAGVRYDPLINNSQNKFGGGVRVRKVENFDSNGQAIDSREFFYSESYLPTGPTGLSTGILGGQTFYFYLPPQGSATTGSGDMYSINPASASNIGSIVTYSQITEVQSDGSFIQRNYSNFDNGIGGEYMDAEPIYRMGAKNKYAFSSKAFERGKLLNERIYSVKNGVHKLLFNSVSNYIRLNESTNFLRTYDIRYNGSPISSYETSAIKVGIYPYVLSNMQMKTYDQSDPGNESKVLVTNTAYNYVPIGQSIASNDLLPRKVTMTNPTGEKVITENKYASDYGAVITPIGPAAGGISYLQQNHIVDKAIESITYLQRDENGSTLNYLMSGFLNTYKVFGNGKGLLWENYARKIADGTPFTTYGWSTVTGNAFNFDPSSFKLASSINDYDIVGNPLSATLADGINNTYAWGYNNSLPVSFVSNQEASQLIQHKVDYLYLPMVGVSEITDLNSLKTNVTYDVRSRVRYISDNDDLIIKRFLSNYKDEYINSTDFKYSTISSSPSQNSLQFETTSLNEPGSTLIWDFGNAIVKENGSSTELQSYTTPGEYVIKLATTHPEFPTGLTSKTVRILPPASAQITSPVTGTSHTVCGNHTTVCSVSITEGPYTYQWERNYSSGSGTFLPIGTNSNTFTFKLTGVQSSTSRIRCKVTDPNGNSRYSNEITILHWCSGQPSGQGDCPSGWTWNAQLGRCDPPAGYCDEGCFWDGTMCVCY